MHVALHPCGSAVGSQGSRAGQHAWSPWGSWSVGMWGGCSHIWLLVQLPQAAPWLLQAAQEEDRHAIPHLLILQPSLPLLAFLFCPLLFPFVVPPILFLSSLSLFFLSRLLSPPHPPFLLFSVLSTSDPHAITPAGSSSPGGCRGCVTDALDQQGAVAQACALAPSSWLPALHQESWSPSWPRSW